MSYTLTPNDSAIDDLLNEVGSSVDDGHEHFPGLSYEDGILEATRWLLGLSLDHPYEDA